MMGTQAVPERLFYGFCLEDHVPDNHLVHRALSVGIGRDQARHRRQTLRHPQASGQAAAHHSLKHMAQEVALRNR